MATEYVDKPLTGSWNPHVGEMRDTAQLIVEWGTRLEICAQQGLSPANVIAEVMATADAILDKESDERDTEESFQAYDERWSFLDPLCDILRAEAGLPYIDNQYTELYPPR